jgi:hypothetical protein
MYFVSVYENRRMKPVEIVLRREREEGEKRRTVEEINLRYIVSTYVNIKMYPPVQLLYVKNFFKKVLILLQTRLGLVYFSLAFV